MMKKMRGNIFPIILVFDLETISAFWRRKMQGTQGFSQKISAHSVQLKVEIEDGREASLKAIVSYNY